MGELVNSFLDLESEARLCRGIFWTATGNSVFVIFVLLRQIWAHFEDC